MSDQQNSPETPEPSPSPGVEGVPAVPGVPVVPIIPEPDPIETDLTNDTVTVRRAPRYGRFITLGAIVGAVVALALTFAFSGQPADAELQPGFDKGQVFGFLLILCATIGAALGAVVALLIDRASARRARSVTVEHESTHRVDE